jgi:hypothetical protein
MDCHTPGPWSATFHESGGYECMFGAWALTASVDGWVTSIATVDQSSYGQDPCDTAFRSGVARANAHLLSASPDLLAALRTMDQQFRALLQVQPHFPLMEQEHALNLAQAAIAKAEGMQS